MLTDLDYELLSAYIDDALTEPERVSLESRLQTEPELHAELEELRATVSLLNNLPVLKAPRDFTLDTRYARRSSFFTSATFSALSSAAAIILFAFGTYLLNLSSNGRQSASTGQAAQVAVASTDSAPSLDKTSNETPTLSSLLSGSASPDEELAEVNQNNDQALNQTIAQTPTEADGFFLFQSPPEQETAASGDTSAYSAAPVPSDEQARTADATETLVGQVQSSEPDSGVTGGEPVAPMSDAAGAAMIQPTLPPAAPLPAATFAPTNVPLPTQAPTKPPTQISTITDLPSSTNLPPTLQPVVVPPATTTSVDIPAVLLVMSVAFFILAIVTTVIRQRNRL